MSRSAPALRLLCVSHYFDTHRGGIEIVAGQLARNIEADVTWAASDASPAPEGISALALRSWNVIERYSGLPFPLPTPGALARLFTAVRTSDAVLVHDGMYPTSLMAVISARLLGRPVLLVQHIGRVPANSLLLRTLFTLADRLLTRPILRLASQVVFISGTTARHFSRVRTLREPELIFNGLNGDFRPSTSEKERLAERRQLGWPEDKPVVLFVGRFIEKKGLLRLKEMARRRPDLQWAFAGWGPCDPDDWHLPNVTVHRGRSGSELAPLYRAADLLVLPSKSEGFPLVVQEALACGLPSVCCEDGATADQAAAAHVVSVPNAGSEAQIISRYLTEIDALASSDQRPEDRARRADFARRRYSLDRVARRYSELLKSLAAAAARPAAMARSAA